MEHTYTFVENSIVQCNNCGDYADTVENIEHHKTCVPGEALKWEEFYEKANYEEEDCL